MLFKLTSVVMLLAIASSVNARPRDPDPLDSSSSQEVTPEHLKAVNRSGALDSRYMMMRKRQVSSTSLTSNPKHNISITSVKYGNSSSNSNIGMGLSVLSGLRIEADRKSYLPLGISSFAASPTSNILKSLPKATRQSIDIDHNPLTIPIFSSPQTPIILPIPLSASGKNEIIIANLTSLDEQKLFFSQVPVPVSSSANDSTNSVFRPKRMLSRNFVRIIPQKLKSEYKVRRNLTNLKKKPELVNVQIKNWPNEALQNVQDLLNYENYISFNNDKSQASFEKFNISDKREPFVNISGIQYPLVWSKVPALDALSLSNNRIDSMIHIDSLLDDLRKNNIVRQQYEGLPELKKNDLSHTNVDYEKASVPLTQPIFVNSINRKIIGKNRSPQNVHIIFMMDKDESLFKNKTTGQSVPPKQILNDDTNCPTIMINSITQINNTIESKEGCTDLNIIINSHILNTNIFESIDSPVPLSNSSYETLKNPYSDNVEVLSDNNQSNLSPNNYYNNYDSGYKQTLNQVQASEFESVEFIEPTPDTSSFEIFQDTHIDIGGDDQNISNPSDDEDFFNIPGSGESISTNTDELTSSDQENGNNAVSINAEETNPASQFSEAGSVIGQANDAAETISVPNLPNLPNLPSVPGQLISSASNGQTSLSSTSVISNNQDDDDLFDVLSPAGLLESISSVFTYLSELNPVNYGIFSIAVAPFIAFAAGILGVIAFLFPWAFPGNFDLSRGWHDNISKINIRFNENLRDIVQRSIQRYKHLNEWKGRRRKKRKKR